MGTGRRQQILIVGCGRVGIELALGIAEHGHLVTVVDNNTKAFERLGRDFSGRTVQGEALDRDVLLRAGIDSADGFAAVTTSDSANIIVARIARDIFHVPHVVARVYNPRRTAIYEKFGLQTVASSSWGAQRIEQLILHPGLQSLYAVGHGEVQTYEISIPEHWVGRKLGDLVPAGQALPSALVRGGRALLPTLDTPLQLHDVVQLSATPEGAAALRQRLELIGG